MFQGTKVPEDESSIYVSRPYIHLSVCNGCIVDTGTKVP